MRRTIVVSFFVMIKLSPENVRNGLKNRRSKIGTRMMNPEKSIAKQFSKWNAGFRKPIYILKSFV